MKRTSDIVLRELEKGFLPYEFNFNLDRQEKIDWTALDYSYTRDYDYWLSLQPEGLLDQFPCLEAWYKEMWETIKDKSPLDEIEERQKTDVASKVVTEPCEIKSENNLYSNDSEEQCNSNN